MPAALPRTQKGMFNSRPQSKWDVEVSPGAYIFLYNGAVTLQFQQPGPLTYRAGLK